MARLFVADDSASGSPSARLRPILSIVNEQVIEANARPDEATRAASAAYEASFYVMPPIKRSGAGLGSLATWVNFSARRPPVSLLSSLRAEVRRGGLCSATAGASTGVAAGGPGAIGRGLGGSSTSKGSS